MPKDRILIHGIDEAGYGPLLGPLVLARCDARPVTTRGKSPSSDFAVDDSKRLFGTQAGRARVEAALLGALKAEGGSHPESLRAWLKQDAHPDVEADLEALPWYAERDLSLPRLAQPEAIDRAAREAEKGLLLSGLEFRGFALRVVTAPRFNRAVRDLGNKHRFLFEEVCQLIESMPAAEERRLTVDRLGGRKFYGEVLGSNFPFRAWEILEETKRRSAYRADLDGGATEIAFLVGADGAHPEVSFASMAAKYTRELLMELFNRHWCRQVPELRPTAGYYTDGVRFLDDLERVGLLPADRELLVRGR